MGQSMIHRLLLGLAVTFAFVAGPAAVAAAPAEPDRYIILTMVDPTEVARAHGLAPDHVYTTAVRGFAATVPAPRLQALRSDARVRLVEPDYVVNTYEQTIPTGINRSDAEKSATANINGSDQRVNVDVAIVDTGIQTNHPDLNVVGGKNCANGKSYADGNGHGTHVAGTVGAIDNGSGVVGGAPGARLWAVRVLDNRGSGFLSWVLCGVNWVAENAGTVEVANMSLGFSGTSVALNDAITTAVARGIVFAVAAGNSNADAGNYSPANHPGVLTVSALADSNGLPGGGGAATSYGADDTLASFSNYGSVVDLAAPGVDILSTYKGSAYTRMSGTSMASPHVAGAAALYLATRPKPVDAAGALAVRTAIVVAAFPQAGPEGFSGDRDGSAEPLLNAGAF